MCYDCCKHKSHKYSGNFGHRNWRTELSYRLPVVFRNLTSATLPPLIRRTQPISSPTFNTCFLVFPQSALLPFQQPKFPSQTFEIPSGRGWTISDADFRLVTSKEKPAKMKSRRTSDPSTSKRAKVRVLLVHRRKIHPVPTLDRDFFHHHHLPPSLLTTRIDARLCWL